VTAAAPIHVLTWCADERWRISERRIIPVFRDLARAPITT
jgi:hypothetical protein